MSEKKEIKISAAKGRPMLSWVGKRPLRHVTAFPAQHMETFAPVENVGAAPCSRPSFTNNGNNAGGAHMGEALQELWKGWPAAYPHGGLLFHGDNKEVLAHLLANGFRGKVKLIYIDPPFDSGADYVRKVQLRGGAATAKIEGESYALGEQIQYTDIWANDNYLQFMYERLQLLKELLAEDGSIYLHCDSNRIHFLRCLLEEIFGAERFQSQIAWQRSTPKGNMTRGFGSAYDSILYFTKTENPVWNNLLLEHSTEYVSRYYSSVEEGTGRKYQLTSLLSPASNRPNLTYALKGHLRVWRYTSTT
jgi:adenine specific DNA methylase Mod